MASKGYQAVALEPAVAHKLRGVAHYLSLTATKRVSMSDALDQLVSLWVHTLGLDPTVAAAITGQPQPVREASNDNARPSPAGKAKRAAVPAGRTGPARSGRARNPGVRSGSGLPKTGQSAGQPHVAGPDTSGGPQNP